MLGIQGSCKDVHEVATMKLVDPATNTTLLESWNYDSDLLIALLDVAHEIRMMGNCRESYNNVNNTQSRTARDDDSIAP